LDIIKKNIEDSSSIILHQEILEHIVRLLLQLINYEITDSLVYAQCIEPYLVEIADEEIKHRIVESTSKKLIDTITLYDYNPEDEEENLCDCMFSLAYGTRVLLHQTPLKLKLNRVYGVLGHNGAGKSTLMRAMANKTLSGFPDISATYIEHHIPEENYDMIVLDYIESNEKIKIKNIPREEIISSLLELNVTEHMMNSPLSTLSGGNVQRVNLVIAKLINDPLQLMDEPTNHIDAITIEWLKKYIKNLKTSTFLIISHDIKFLDEICTNVIHYENLKLKVYRGNMTEFVKQKPEAAFYFQTTSSDILSFNIPEPGPLEGVKSLTKSVLSMKNCYFQYETAPKPQLSNITVQISMASRVVIAGVNGAGKSTLVKLLVGEIEPNQGLIERHPNLRMAYIPQNISVTLEPHKDKTPIEYIMWRYRLGYDREQSNKNALTLSDEEINKIRAKAKEDKTFVIKEFVSRRAGKREHEYEAKSEGVVELTQWFNKTELIMMGYEKMIKEFDEKLAMESMMGQRKLTTGEIQKHLDFFGLEPEIAQHTRISSLSSGQKMRCYLGSATFFLPHVIIFDEPTNFLDKESTSALSDAIKNFKGGVLVISHNADFYDAITREKWLLDNGSLTVFGDDIIEALEKERKRQEKENAKKLKFNDEEEKFDSFGNKIEAVIEKKELTRDEKKKLMKQRKDLIKNNQDTYDIDILLGLC
jgi:elongation factor 3